MSSNTNNEETKSLHSIQSIISLGGVDTGSLNSIIGGNSTSSAGASSKNSAASVISKWSEADEELLKEWADHAACFHWLHEQSYIKYNNIYTYINIPIIIISTITGTANFAQSKIADEAMRDIVSMVIGFFSISAGILATCMSFFKIGERKERHNNCAKLWDKLYRNIQMEMAKPPKERINKKTMMELTKKEYDRLIDDSPLIPEEITAEFNRRFKNNTVATTMNKPNVLDVFHTIRINHYEEPEEKEETENDMIQMVEMKFKELNGRLPTELELQNIIEMQRGGGGRNYMNSLSGSILSSSALSNPNGGMTNGMSSSSSGGPLSGQLNDGSNKETTSETGRLSL